MIILIDSVETMILSDRVTARVKSPEKDMFQRAANLEHVSLSKWIRLHLIEDANIVLAHYEHQ